MREKKDYEKKYSFQTKWYFKCLQVEENQDKK